MTVKSTHWQALQVTADLRTVVLANLRVESSLLRVSRLYFTVYPSLKYMESVVIVR